MFTVDKSQNDGLYYDGGTGYFLEVTVEDNGEKVTISGVFGDWSETHEAEYFADEYKGDLFPLADDVRESPVDIIERALDEYENSSELQTSLRVQFARNMVNMEKDH